MRKPLLVVIGSPGTGKTFEVLKAFQEGYALFTDRNNGHFFFTQLAKKKLPAEVKPPKRIMLLEEHGFGASKEDYAPLESIEIQYGPLGPNGMPTPIAAKTRIEALLDAIIKRSREAAETKQPPPYKSLIIDELGVALDRVHNEILPTITTRDGTIDTRGAFGAMKTWVMHTFMSKLRELNRLGVAVALVAHDREPDDKANGGVATPSRGISKGLAAAADIVLMRYVMDFEEEVDVGGKKVKRKKARRFWDGRASEEWDIKLRGLDDEELDQITEMELREILPFAGYDM